MLPPGVELVCPDLLGHGALRDEPFRLGAALEAARSLVASAGGRRVVLVGDSLGGYIALLAAARAPEGIGAVVAGGCTWTMNGAAGELARASDLPVRALARLAGESRIERWLAAFVPRLTDRETAKAIVQSGLRLRSRSESLAELRGVDLVAEVRRIRVPIVFVNGARDWPTRAGEGALLRSAPHASVILAPRTGHGVGLLDPATFARAIASVVRS